MRISTACVVALSGLCLLLVGCIDIQGNVRYAVSGRLLQADGATPLAGAEVSGTTSLPGSCAGKHTAAGGPAVSDRDGRFEFTIAQSRWSRTLLLGFVPLEGSAPAAPPTLDELTLHVVSNGRQVDIRISVPISRQSKTETATRVVEIGPVTLPSGRAPLSPHSSPP